MKTPILLTLVTLIPSLAHAGNYACVSDERAADGPYSGVILEYQAKQTNMWAVNSVTAMNGDSGATLVTLNNAHCSGGVNVLESFPVQYEPNVTCTLGHVSLVMRPTDNNKYELRVRDLGEMGEITQDRELFAPKGQCKKIDDATLAKLKADFVLLASQRRVTIQGRVQLVRPRQFGPKLATTALVDGKVLTASADVNAANAQDLAQRGFATINFKAPQGQALRNCEKAVLTVNASEGNFLPNNGPEEVYTAPAILKFECLDQ